MVIVGAGAAARADGAAVLGLAARVALAAMDGKDAGWNAFNVLHTAPPRASPASISASCRPRARSTWPRCSSAAGKGKLDVLYLLGADEIDAAAVGLDLRHLSGQPRRPQRAPRRRHPSRRRLHGEERNLRQHRGPRAGDRARRLPAGRRQGGLGDHSRALRRRPGTRCPTIRSRPCARRCTRRRRSSPASAPSRRLRRDGLDALAKRGSPLAPEPFAAAVQDFYLTNPIARASAVMAEMSALKASMRSQPRLKAAE